MPTPTLIAYDSITSTTSSIEINAIACNVGDLLVIIESDSYGSGYLDPPSGFNLVNSDISEFGSTISMFYKFATASEPNTYLMEFNGDTPSVLFLMCFSNVDSFTDNSDKNFTSYGSEYPIQGSSGIETTDGILFVAGVSINAGTTNEISNIRDNNELLTFTDIGYDGVTNGEDQICYLRCAYGVMSGEGGTVLAEAYSSSDVNGGLIAGTFNPTSGFSFTPINIISLSVS